LTLSQQPVERPLLPIHQTISLANMDLAEELKMSCQAMRMKRWHVLKPIALSVVVMLILGAVQKAWAAADRYVVVVCIDGFAAYLLDDPKAPVPTLRSLAKEGAVAEGGMKVSNPSITWPNHTTLVSGVRPEKHGMLANGVLVRGAPGVAVYVEPKKDKKDLVRVPTLLDLAHAQGLRTADVNWPCTRGAESLDDSFPDVPEQVTHMTPRLRDELIKLGVLADASDKSFAASSAAGKDLIWTETARHIIRTRKPNLLVLHLLNCDSTHHAEGAQSPPGYTANAYADMCLARVLAAIDEAGIRDRTTVIVVADHGFTLTPKAIRPNIVLGQNGLLRVAPGGKIAEARVHVVPEGGIGLVYCTDPATAAADAKHVQQLLQGLEGVAAVLAPEQFGDYGLPHPREYSQAPDLVLVAKDGYGVSGVAEGETFVTPGSEAKVPAGSHGFVSTVSKMNAVCVLSGCGIRRGVRMKNVENIDIAPTIARLLGLTGLPADGRVLSEALDRPEGK
jgi:predicted AlkP superfamily pyrophosphatase or phosphodiesterase